MSIQSKCINLKETINISNYQLLNLLGGGAFGCVFIALDLTKNRRVAIKILDKNHNTLEDFKTETMVLHRVQTQCSQYFLCYVNQMEDSQNYYIISQYLTDYVTLTSILGDFDFLTPPHLKLIIQHLIEAVLLLHDLKIAHRDLKPDNIMINLKTCQIKIIDFGLGCYLKCSLTDSRGTASYTPPETYLQSHNYQQSLKQRQMVDLFSLGNIIWILLSMGNQTRYQCWSKTQLLPSIVKYLREYQFIAKDSFLFVKDHEILRRFELYKPNSPNHDVSYSLKMLLDKNPLKRDLFVIYSH